MTDNMSPNIEAPLAELTLIPLDLLDDHPGNPRLIYREDIIDAVAAGIGTEYEQKYAVHARPIGDRFQLVSGHQRARAARKANLSHIWAWVEALTDDEAFMELVTSNNQGELGPLEIGIHALQAVPLGKGGRGKKGGLTEYATLLGKAKSRISEYRAAAEVFLTARETVPAPEQLCDKAQHLSAIHAAKDLLWPILVVAMLEKAWSADDTSHYVAKVREFGDVLKDNEWAEVFLDEVLVVAHFLKTKEFSPKTVAALAARASSVVAAVTAAAEAVETETEPFVAMFVQWLRDNQGVLAWDVRQIEAKEREILALLAPRVDDDWHCGDWRKYLDKLGDNTVSLILTDPPYGVEFQSDYRLDRRKERKHDTIANDDCGPAETEAALAALLPKLKDNAHVLCFCHWSNEAEVRDAIQRAGYAVLGSLVWVKNNTGMGDPKTTFAPKHERIIHAVKGSPVLFEREADVLEADRVNSERHPTEKPVDLLKRLIDVTTVGGEMVADPFGGVASTLVAAKELGRAYWGCEISDEYHAIGAKRLNGWAFY
jgi:site-specific DNA-methyltransferase (adenine-specific)